MAHKTSPRMILAAQRRALVIKERLSGKTYDSIVTFVRAQFGDRLPKGYGPRECCRDVSRELAKLATQRAQGIAALRELELARLVTLLTAVWCVGISGYLPSIDRALSVVSRHAKVSGAEISLTQVAIVPGDFNAEAWNAGREKRHAEALSILDSQDGT